jgi:hypothetical protein
MKISPFVIEPGQRFWNFRPYSGNRVFRVVRAHETESDTWWVYREDKRDPGLGVFESEYFLRCGLLEADQQPPANGVIWNLPPLRIRRASTVDDVKFIAKVLATLPCKD